MTTANRKCPEAGFASGPVPVCCSLLAGKLGPLLLLRLSICSHNASSFSGRGEQPRSWSINAVWIKMLCPKQALKSKADPKLLICGFLGQVLNIALLLCATSFFYFLAAYCTTSLWSQNISRCPIIFPHHGRLHSRRRFLFITHAEPQETGPEMYFSTP